jgi:amino acid transporter
MTKNTDTKSSAKKDASVEDRAHNAASAISAKFSGPLAPLEKSLNDVFGEKAPYKIPKNGRDFLVKIAPWLSLAGGAFGIISAIGLWRAAHYVNQWVDYANRLSASLGGPAQANKLGLFFWLSLVSLVIFALLSLLAFPGLKAKKKIGWNLMFYSAIASLVFSVVSLFYDGGGFGSFISTAIGTVLGLYILFQVRSHYKA